MHILTYIYTYIDTYIYTYILTNKHKYLHKYIQAYISTYIHACVYTYVYVLETYTGMKSAGFPWVPWGHCGVGVITILRIAGLTVTVLNFSMILSGEVSVSLRRFVCILLSTCDRTV